MAGGLRDAKGWWDRRNNRRLLGIVASLATISIGSVASAYGERAGDVAVGIGVLGLICSFGSIIFGALALNTTSKVPAIFLLLFGGVGMFGGGRLIAPTMFLTVVASILTSLGVHKDRKAAKAQRELERRTSLDAAVGGMTKMASTVATTFKIGLIAAAPLLSMSGQNAHALSLSYGQPMFSAVIIELRNRIAQGDLRPFTSDVKALFADKTLIVDREEFEYYAPNGELVWKYFHSIQSGKWNVAGRQLCVTYDHKRLLRWMLVYIR